MQNNVKYEFPLVTEERKKKRKEQIREERSNNPHSFFSKIILLTNLHKRSSYRFRLGWRDNWDS